MTLRTVFANRASASARRKVVPGEASPEVGIVSSQAPFGPAGCVSRLTVPSHQPSAAAAYLPGSPASEGDSAPRQSATLPALQKSPSSLDLQASTVPRDEVGEKERLKALMRGIHYRLPKSFWAVLLLPLLQVSCDSEAPSASVNRAALEQGTVVTEHRVLAAPDRNWSLYQEKGIWRFRGSATIRILIPEKLHQPLTFFLRPEGETTTKQFHLLWNGELLGGFRQGAELSLELPPRFLSPGKHTLEVKRVVFDEPIQNTFLEVGFSLEGTETLLPVEDRERLRYLANFMNVGLTGKGRQTYGGVLFAGNAALETRVEMPASGRLDMVVENLSNQIARVDVETEGEHKTVSLEEKETVSLQLPLSQGEQDLKVQVKGGESALVLLGEPAIELDKPQTNTPIFLITLDTTRRDAISPYNGKTEVTPHIQEFSSRATVYDNAFSVSPWTLPSHASIMTGLYPSRHGAGVKSQILPMEVPTLAASLRDHGYLTAGFAGGQLCSHSFGIGQGFSRYLDPETFETTGDRLTDSVLSLLDQHHGKNLFVFANYFDPHATYKAPEEYQKRLQVDQLRPALAQEHVLWQYFDQGSSDAWRKIIDGETPPPSPEVQSYMEAAYLSEVAFMDAQIGRLFERLREWKLFERALIVLVADHGELRGEYGGLYSHAGRLDPELTEIPLIIKWPGQREGRRVDDLVSQVDLFTSILAAVGIEAPANDGERLLATGKELPQARLVFLEEHESRVHPLPRRLKIAPHVYGVQRSRRRQIVWKHGGECFRRNSTANDWVLEECETTPEEAMTRIEQTLGRPAAVADAGQLSDEDRDALKALGYL